MGKALGDPRPERIADDAEAGKVERVGEIGQRVGIGAAAGRVLDQIIAEHVAGRVPGDDAVAVAKPGELEAPIHRIGADAVQQDERRGNCLAGFHVAEAVAAVAATRSSRDRGEFELGKRRQRAHGSARL